MGATLARVVNTDHNNQTLGVFTDLPHITWTFKRNDVSTGNWTIPLSHDNLTREGFGPKRTDFRIGVSLDNGVNWNTVHAGICGPVGLDTDKDSVEVTGVDWTAWLDQGYRFDGYQKDFANEKIRSGDVSFVWNPGTFASTIINDLVANLCSGTALQCVQIPTPLYYGTEWSTVPILAITIADQTNVLSEIKRLGELREPDGYEFVMGWDKYLRVYFGRQFTASPESVLPTNSVASFSPSRDNIQRLQWVNHGPKAITTVGMPITFPGQKGFSTYSPSIATYRDWWQFLKVGGIKDIVYYHGTGNYIDVYTDTYATRDRFPQKDLTITFDPTNVPVYGLMYGPEKYWFENRTGHIIHVDSEDWFIDYWRIDDYFWIVDQTLTCDDAGNWTCTCTLEDTNASA